jgi:xylulokinase
VSATYLGIDLGTSGVKALLVDSSETVVAEATAPLTVQRPHPLWSEQNPADWWTATIAAVRAIVQAAPAAAASIEAIGLSGQMHGAVLLDAAQQVLRPAILWNDGRSGAECAELERRVPDLHRLAGNAAMPGFTAPKLLWVAAHEPDIFARMATVLLPKDWLRLKLTGEAMAEISDAAGTLWLDVAARRWSPEVLAACGMDAARMPPLVEGSAPAGRLTAAAAAELGLRPGILLAGGGADNAAAAIGLGVVDPGRALLTLVFF